MDRQELQRLAATYLWWSPPEKVISENLERLAASVMELGTWDDANKLLDAVGPETFVSVLESPPPGVLSDKSLAFWHYRLGRPGAPPKARPRFT
jgi:hypothetical protein